MRPKGILAVLVGPEGFHRIYPNTDEVEFIDIVFDCQALNGTLGCLDGEVVEVRYFDRQECLTLPLSYPVSLSTLLNYADSPFFH